jgi:hypothetical protein
MKQKIKGKNCAVFCFAGKKKLLFIYYAVIVKQKFYKRSTNYYSFGHVARLGGGLNTRGLRPPSVRPNHLAAPSGPRDSAPWDVPAPWTCALGRRFRDPKPIS